MGGLLTIVSGRIATMGGLTSEAAQQLQEPDAVDGAGR
jgi:hypothetical protein